MDVPYTGSRVRVSVLYTGSRVHVSELYKDSRVLCTGPNSWRTTGRRRQRLPALGRQRRY